MKKIFMVSYGGGHANIMKLIYHHLVEHYECQIVYLALTGAPYQLRNDEVDFITISTAAKMLPYYTDIIKLGTEYGEQYHNSNSHIDNIDTICYYGIGLYDLIIEKGVENAFKAFQAENRKSFLPVNTMMNILSEIKPDICVITTSPRMEKATAIAANRLKIPVVRINDTPICEKMDYSCSLCVMNSWARQYAMKYSGIEPSDIFITGQPVFENNMQLEDSLLCEIENITNSSIYNSVVTFFTENGFNQEKELNSLYHIAREFTDTLFVVKIHPNQVESEFSIPKLNNIVIRNDPAKYYYALSDIIINAWSTTGMEAAMLGLPVIVVNFDDRLLPIDYVGMGIAVSAKNENELKLALAKLMNHDSEMSRTLENGRKKFEFVNDSVNKICNVIINKSL